MKTELMHVPPHQAREWLKKNTENRRLRPGVVESLAAAYGRGEWKATHQGIAFSKGGRLLDGQHRLTFIAQLPDGVAVPLNVTFGADDATYDAIDIGHTRTTSDVYGVTGAQASVGRYAARIYNSSAENGLTNQYIKPFIDWVRPELDDLLAFCPSVARVWSSANVRTAAIFQMKRGMDPDFIKSAYRALIFADVEQAPYAGRLLLQQYVSGKLSGTRTVDLFCRSLRVFDSENNVKMMRLRVDPSAVMTEVREWISTQMRKKGTARPNASFVGRH